MAIPAVNLARIIGNSNITASITRPVRPGRRPFTDMTKSKRPVLIKQSRGLTTGTAITTAATLAVFGADLPYQSAAFPMNTSGQLTPGIDPVTNTATGSYVERIKLTTANTTATTAVGITNIVVLNGGSGYTSAPAVTFSSGAAAGTAVIDPDTGAVVGITVTNAGTGYTTPPTITIAAPNLANGVQAIAACGLGQVKTIYTHIPYVANAPTTDGGAIWLLEWKDRLISCSSAVSLNADDKGSAKAEQHVFGSATAGFTVASGTHPDGTASIAVLTLSSPGTNGANFGLAYNEQIYVYRALVRQLTPGVNVVGATSQMANAMEVMWIGVTGDGTADTSSVSVTLDPANH